MASIIDISDSILIDLLKRSKKNPNFRFVPRKQNRSNRLRDGYWFQGNNNYLCVSLWEGDDLDRHVHNIGFIAFSDGTSYLQLTARRDKNTAKFLESVMEEIGADGFTKCGREIWRKDYSGSDVLKNLNYHIEKEKPVIDKLINKLQPKHISQIDNEDFEYYIDRITTFRNQLHKINLPQKISKICWNTNSWQYPSGIDGKSEYGSFEQDYSFGYEEWLLDRTRVLDDGFHYGFLQPLNIISDRHEHWFYNIHLVTKSNNAEWFYVGMISEVECISKEDSVIVYQEYEKRGWIEEMALELEKKKVDSYEFRNTAPEVMFNVRFRLNNMNIEDDPILIDEEDENISTNRYKLLPLISNWKFASSVATSLLGNSQNEKLVKRSASGEIEYNPVHAKMQNLLGKMLSEEQTDVYSCVEIEKNRVDVKAQTRTGDWHFFEIKTNNVKQCLRLAIGQLLEYSFYPDVEKAVKLVVIGQEMPSEDDLSYLNQLRERFKLPLYYRCLDISSCSLSNEFPVIS